MRSEQCDRCRERRRLFWLGDRRLCDACWKWEAVDKAIAAGQRKFDLMSRKRV